MIYLIMTLLFIHAEVPASDQLCDIELFHQAKNRGARNTVHVTNRKEIVSNNLLKRIEKYEDSVQQYLDLPKPERFKMTEDLEKGYVQVNACLNEYARIFPSSDQLVKSLMKSIKKLH